MKITPCNLMGQSLNLISKVFYYVRIFRKLRKNIYFKSNYINIQTQEYEHAITKSIKILEQ